MNRYQQVVISQWGDTDTLKCQEATLPELLPHQVVVKVDYCAVNPIDVKTRQGANFVASQKQQALPWVLGYDIAGKIVEQGAQVTSLRIGQRVAGMIGFPLGGGGYSQYCVVDANSLSKLPDQVDMRQASAVSLAGLTALQALELANVQQEERVLILAGSGGVGHIAIQLAKAQGCQVLATGSPTNQAFMQSLGAIAIDYTQGNLAEHLEPVDVLIDLVGGEVGCEALTLLKPNGRGITVPTVTKEMVLEKAQSLHLHVQGMVVTPNVTQQDLLLEMIAQKSLRVHIDQQYDFDSVASAHQHIESGRTRGKIVLAAHP